MSLLNLRHLKLIARSRSSPVPLPGLFALHPVHLGESCSISRLALSLKLTLMRPRQKDTKKIYMTSRIKLNAWKSLPLSEKVSQHHLLQRVTARLIWKTKTSSIDNNRWKLKYNCQSNKELRRHQGDLLWSCSNNNKHNNQCLRRCLTSGQEVRRTLWSPRGGLRPQLFFR